MLMVSPVTVRQWARKGLLRSTVTVGGHRRFARAEVERFLTRNTPPDPRNGPGQARVLIVDGDVRFVNALIESLSAQPIPLAFEKAHDGFTAGQVVETFRPDILLLDLKMPGIDGFQVCRRLKTSAATQSMRVIAMTGYYNEEHSRRIIELGAETCLSKPLDTTALLTAMGFTRPSV